MLTIGKFLGTSQVGNLNKTENSMATLKPDSYPLWEGVSLVVSAKGGLTINAATPARPDEAKIRAEVRARHQLAITLGGWRLDNCVWNCPVTSQLKVVTPKRKSSL
jgi:hypothetical protein